MPTYAAFMLARASGRPYFWDEAVDDVADAVGEQCEEVVASLSPMCEEEEPNVMLTAPLITTTDEVDCAFPQPLVCRDDDPALLPDVLTDFDAFGLMTDLNTLNAINLDDEKIKQDLNVKEESRAGSPKLLQVVTGELESAIMAPRPSSSSSSHKHVCPTCRKKFYSLSAVREHAATAHFKKELTANYVRR